MQAEGDFNHPPRAAIKLALRCRQSLRLTSEVITEGTVVERNAKGHAEGSSRCQPLLMVFFHHAVTDYI